MDFKTDNFNAGALISEAVKIKDIEDTCYVFPLAVMIRNVGRKVQNVRIQKKRKEYIYYNILYY